MRRGRATGLRRHGHRQLFSAPLLVPDFAARFTSDLEPYQARGSNSATFTRATSAWFYNTDTGLVEKAGDSNPELLADPTLDDEASWTVVEAGTSTVTFSAGSVNITADGSGSDARISQDIMEVGKTYRILVTGVTINAGTGMKVATQTDDYAITTDGDHEFWHDVTVGTTVGFARIGASDDVDFTGVSVREASRHDSRGVLIEGARTNICLQSEDLSATWTNTNSVDTQNHATAPDGATTANRLIDDSSTGAGIVVATQTVTVSSGSNTISVFAKADQLDWLNLRFENFDSSGNSFFDLTNGVVGSTAASSSGIESMGSGWYRWTRWRWSRWRWC